MYTIMKIGTHNKRGVVFYRVRYQDVHRTGVENNFDKRAFSGWGAFGGIRFQIQSGLLL